MLEYKDYNFKGHKVRMVYRGDKLWFVAADVCIALGYAVRAGGKANVSMATEALARDEKAVITPSSFSKISQPELSGWPNRGLICVSESGLYKLVLRSDKPEAREFQDWVTREVLPAIRKDGMYVMGEEKLKTGEMSDDEFILAAMEKLQAKVGRITKELNEERAARSAAEARVVEYQPKAEKVRVMSRKPSQSFLNATKRCI